MNRRILPLLALWALLTLPGCPRDFSLPAGPGGGERFQLTLLELDPPILTRGGPVLARFGASESLDRNSCDADLGGSPIVDCELTLASECTCQGTVGDHPDGPLLLFFRASSLEGTGEGTETVMIDSSPPAIAAGSLSIERTPVGSDDEVLGLGTSITEMGPSYSTAGVAEVRIWTSESATTPRVRVSGPLSDGAQAISGSTGDPGLAPPQVWVSAVDVAGNESPRVRIATGEDLEPPVIDQAGVELEIPLIAESVARNQTGRADAITALGCVPMRVEFFEDATGQQPLGSTGIAADGAFTLALGSRLERVYLRAVDKCGHTSAVVEARRVVAHTDPNISSPASIAISDGNALADPATLSLTALRSTAFDRSASAGLDAEDTERLITSVDPLVATPASWLDAAPATAPFGFMGAQLEWDPIRQAMVMVGDVGNGMETWIHDGANWSLATPTTTELPYRWDHAMAWNQALGGMVVFGGFDDTNPLGDTWLWNGTDWAQLSIAGSPSARRGHVMARNPVRDVIVLFGGEDAGGSLSETWEFDGAIWSQITTTTNPPWPTMTTMAFHDHLGVMVLFGGGIRNQLTWYYSGADWSRPSLAIEPPGRLRSAMAYDANRQVMVLFGGDQENDNRSGDTWELSTSGWLPASPAASPDGRLLHAMGYDRARQRVMMLGGSIENFGSASVTWEYTPTATPGPRWAYQLYDFSNAAAVHPDGFQAELTAAGSGDPASGGAAEPGIRLSIWDPGALGWIELATHATDESPDGSGRLLLTDPGLFPATYAVGGTVTLLATSPSSSSPQESVPSTIYGDYLRSEMTFTRP